MNKWWMMGVCTGLAVLGTASTVRAEGLELGARVGYGIPFGETQDNADLSDGIAGMIPLQLDLGYRLSPALSLGAYAMYGVGFAGDQISDACESVEDFPGLSASCSATDVRVGFQAQYHLAPRKKLDPWIGMGIGYEWVTFGFEVSGGGEESEVSATGRGFEFFNLQAGLDYRPTAGLGLGPFLTFSMGQLSSTSGSCSGSACDGLTIEDGDIDDKAFHQWLMLGIRGTFVIGDDAEPED